VFAPDGIPNRPSKRLYRASGGRFPVGIAENVRRSVGNCSASSSGVGGTERKGRSPLGTFAKSAASGRNGGKKKGFCKRAIIRTKKKERTAEDERVGRLRRFALQGVSRSILRGVKTDKGKPMFRVALCLRAVVPETGKGKGAVKRVGAQYVPSTKSSHYTNLQQCGSVWTCPCCSAKICEKRRGELARLVEKHIKGHGSVWMVTHTTAHTRFDDLMTLLASFSEAQRKMKAHRQYVELREELGIVGSVKALEVTWSPENGWHVHSHTLVFSSQKDMSVEAYEQVARPLWKQYALKQGLAMNEHGFKIDRTFGAVQDYILKFGHDPATESVWGVESEMVKSHAKQGRVTEHYTPFQLLAAIHDQGREDLKPIFQEYAMCFKGKRQLEYSRGLKALYEDVDEKTDEELVLESQEKEAITFVELEEEKWKAVLANDIRGELLEAVRTGCPGAVMKFLADFDIEAIPAPLAGYRVVTPDGIGVISLVTKCPILGRWRCSVMLESGDGGSWRAFDLTQIVVLGKEERTNGKE